MYDIRPPYGASVQNQSLTLVLQRALAPNLAKSTLEFIHDMIRSSELTVSQIAEAAGCSKRAITRIRSNMRIFGSVKAPSVKAGRPRSITPIMLEALCDRLLEKPGLYLHDMEISC